MCKYNNYVDKIVPSDFNHLNYDIQTCYLLGILYHLKLSKNHCNS